MPSTHSRLPSLVHLRAAGTSLLLDLTDAQLPAVVHWGSDLGPQTPESARALAKAAVPTVGSNAVDEPVRLSLLPEHRTGFVGRPGISGSRAGTAWSPRFTVTGLDLARLDTARSDTTRPHTTRPDDRGTPTPDATDLLESGPATVTIDADDPEQQLGLQLVVQLTPEGVLRSRARLTNRGETYTLDGLTLALPVPARASELLDLAGRWGKEKVPQRSPFGVGTHLREGRKGRTGADAAGVLHAGEAGFGFGVGEIWAVHTAWSGNHVHYAERTFDGHRVIGGGDLLLPGEVQLKRDETYESPWLYGVFGVGLDDVAHRLHRLLRARPEHPSSPRKVTLNVWEAVYFDHDIPRLLDLADRAAALGVERLVLDDGWFGARRDDTAGLGDWVVSTDVWPDGLHPLVDRVREHGMEFGLWFEPEMVNPDSDVARAHPEWIMGARREQPVLARNQQVLNLSIPEAYAHVRDQMMALLQEYPIGYIKWDHNRDLVEAGDRTRDGRPAVHAQTLATYRLMAELKAAHPALEIESRSSGGARVDLGVMEHCDRVWVSDCIDPHERQQMLRWTTQLLPPELCGSHVASGRSHTTGRRHTLGYRAGTALFGHFGIEWDLAEASEQELAELGAWIDVYRDLRELLHTGDTVRIDAPGDGVLVHGVVSPDRDDALFAYVVHDFGLEDPSPRLVLRGLDPERRYRISPVLPAVPPTGLVPPRWWGERAADGTYPGTVLHGAALLAAGVQPPRIQPDQVVLFRVRAEM